MNGNKSSNNTTISSQNSPSYDHSLNTVIASVLIVVIVVAICGNLFVCTAILVHQRLRKTANYFIFSLAISDLLTASFSMSFDVDTLLNPNQWSHGEFVCDFWAVMYMTAAPTSILHLLAVSVDRYKAIKSPLRYCHAMRPKRALVIIAVIWLYSFLFAIISMTGWPFYDHSVRYGICHFNIRPHYSVVSSFVNFILPSLATCVVYFKIYKIAGEHVCRIGKQEMTAKSNSNEDSGFPSEKRVIKKNIKAAKTIAILVSALLVCWMPLTISSTAWSLCYDCFLKSPIELYSALVVLAYVNSALNPILYSFYNREFRQSFKRLHKLQFKFR